MKTWQFSWNGHSRFIDAPTIFDAMVNFHALHEGTNISELHIIELA